MDWAGVGAMKWVAVESSFIGAVAYQGDEEVLWLRFHNDRTYLFRQVPEQTYEKLLAAESKGRFFNSQIKDTFPYARV